jgi:hypothetical protein
MFIDRNAQLVVIDDVARRQRYEALLSPTRDRARDAFSQARRYCRPATKNARSTSIPPSSRSKSKTSEVVSSVEDKSRPAKHSRPSSSDRRPPGRACFPLIHRKPSVGGLHPLIESVAAKARLFWPATRELPKTRRELIELHGNAEAGICLFAKSIRATNRRRCRPRKSARKVDVLDLAGEDRFAYSYCSPQIVSLSLPAVVIARSNGCRRALPA